MSEYWKLLYKLDKFNYHYEYIDNNGQIGIECDNGKFSIVDLEVNFKRCGHGTRLVKMTLEKLTELDVRYATIYPNNTDEAISFWKNFGVDEEQGSYSVEDILEIL